MTHGAVLRAMAAASIAALAVFPADRASAQEPTQRVSDRQGRVLAVLPKPTVAPATPGPADPCPTTERTPGVVLREGRGRGFKVDSCGRIQSDGPGDRPERGARAGLLAAPRVPVTIDRMTTSSGGAYVAGGILNLLGSANVYYLSDGSSWATGAGSYAQHWSQFVRADVDGATIRYVLSPPDGGLLYAQTDFDGGLHQSQGTLGAAGPLVIEATAGSTTAVLHGEALVVSNDTTPAWTNFNYFSAVVGSVVPFEIVYRIYGATWQADTFTRSFNYSAAGQVDFAHPRSTPRAVELRISGSSRIPDQSTTSFRATVRYENNETRDATARASWSVEPSSVASVVGGVLTVGTLATAETALTLRATLAEGNLLAAKAIRCLADDPAEKLGSWPMFQANARHTGYVPISLTALSFSLAWHKELSGLPLNPIAAGEGKVFATVVTNFNDTTHLFALRSADGAVLWSKRFTGAFPGTPGVFSVNPPSFAYGNVYVQTVDHSTDTWLHAFDGTTGAPLFRAPHDAQWEHYYAPTLYEGKAYVNGGYYGGMYAFDAYSGDRLWYDDSLPQYDQWTPAVDGDRVYAYAGPELYVRDRLTGLPAPTSVPDPNFEQSAMNLAPVIGAHGDVVAIHDGRLISFDPASGSIRWEVPSGFAGQPSIAKDRIYAIDGGRLVVLDELTHAELWSWTPASGALAGPMIVTDTHLLASTGDATYAVDLASHQSVWSYPAAGHLALADDMLFIASSEGSLTAISTSGQPSPSNQLSFFTVPPCRLVDTRQASGVPVGGPGLQAPQARVLKITESCAIPSTARAVALNVTVTEPGAPGNLRLYPGGSMPATSTVNYAAGQTRANNAIVPLSVMGNLTAYASQAAGTSLHLIIDVSGYFERVP